MGWVVDGTPELDAQSDYKTVLTVAIVSTVLMVLTLGMRLFVRRSRLGWDDYIVVFGAVSFLCGRPTGNPEVKRVFPFFRYAVSFTMRSPSCVSLRSCAGLDPGPPRADFLARNQVRAWTQEGSSTNLGPHKIHSGENESSAGRPATLGLVANSIQTVQLRLPAVLVDQPYMFQDSSLHHVSTNDGPHEPQEIPPGCLRLHGVACRDRHLRARI